MKSWTKIILGFGIGATLIGAALAGYGFETGGLADLEKNVETLSTTRYHKVSLDTFSKVTIDSSAFDVVVAKENVDKPFISYSDNSKTSVNYEVKDDTLTVKQTGRLSQGENTDIHFFSIRDLINLAKSGIIDNSHTIVITVPQNTNITSLQANLKAGDLDINNLSLDNAKLDVKAGDLTMYNAHINAGTVTLTAGDVDIEHSQLNQFDFTVTTGDLDCDNSQITNTSFKLRMGDFSAEHATFKGEDNSITSTAGDVDITLADKDLKINPSYFLGDADIASDLNTSSQNTLAIDNKAGDITIQ